MKLISNRPEQTQNVDIWQVGLASGNDTYYSALINVKTGKCHVEEVTISQRKMGFTGIYRAIESDAEWKMAHAFFRTAGVFDEFLKGKNWYWSTKDGNSLVPPWFKNKFK